MLFNLKLKRFPLSGLEHHLLMLLFVFTLFSVQLDIVFHFNKVYALLDEFILAGEVQETNKKVILGRLNALEKLE